MEAADDVGNDMGSQRTLEALKNALILFINSALMKPPQAGRAYKMRETIIE